MAKTDPIHEYVIQWLRDEHEYADTKNTQDENTDDKRTRGEEIPGYPTGYEYWGDQIDMYVHRSFTLGLDTPAGRQAAMKAAMTAISFAESVVRTHGPVPEPGVSSGNNLDNLRALVL